MHHDYHTYYTLLTDITLSATAISTPMEIGCYKISTISGDMTSLHHPGLFPQLAESVLVAG